MQLPPSLLDSLELVKGFDREAFINEHESGEQVTSIRLNPSKPVSQFPNFPIPLFPIPWTECGYYLAKRPSFTFDPLFHAGCYYVQEASGMFLEQALKQTADLSKPLKILDLCAAPGGKSTHIQSLLSKDSLLVSNEPIHSRVNALKNNIIQWGCENVIVTSNDPRDFSKLENYFDIIVIDAPCSGSGLFRREPEAILEWSKNNVQLCSQRQQRILADAWPSLKRNGILIYSTCSYSVEEDERIIDWAANQFAVDSLPMRISEFPGIVEAISASGTYSYRFFPDKVKGEGFFMACLRKKGPEEHVYFTTKNKPLQLTKKEIDIVADWFTIENRKLIKSRNTIYAWPGVLYADLSFLMNSLRLIYSGTLVGELMGDKLIPDHALALSGRIAGQVKQTELTYEQAIQYLQRSQLSLETKNKGWQLVTFCGQGLGWINVLPGRINNYYPKFLRIVKDKPGC